MCKMEFLKKGLIILIGCSLIAVGINGFLIPFGLLEGGALGISLIIHYVMDVKVGLTFLLISIPIFTLAWFFYRSFFYNGLHGMLFSSIIIDIFADFFGQQLVSNALTSAACGGIIIGIGAGIMLRSDISIGGTDLLAQMLARKLNVNSGIVIFCFDIVIVTVGSYIIHSAHLLLSFVTVFCIGVTTSLIVSTKKHRKNGQKPDYSNVDIS